MSCAYSHFHLHIDQDAREVALTGEIDTASVVAAAAAVDMLNRVRQGDITLNLEGVTFIDAAGVGAVAAAHDAQLRHGSQLGVTGASIKVRGVFGRADRVDLLEPFTSQRSPARHMHTVPDDTMTPKELPTLGVPAEPDVLQQLAEARIQIENLQIALDTSRRIGTAVGIVMSMYRLTAAEAFDVLTRLSQHTHLKLRDLAEEVILTGQVTTPAR